MRKNSKAIVIRVAPEVWETVRKEAETKKVPITEIAREYLAKGMEKKAANS